MNLEGVDPKEIYPSSLHSHTPQLVFVINSWLGGLSHLTRESYSHSIERLISYYSIDELLNLKLPDLDVFINSLEVGLSTKRKYIASIKGMYKKLTQVGLLETSPAVHLEVKGRSSPKHHQAPDHDVIKEGLRSISEVKSEVIRKRDMAIALLMLNNGLRRAEVSGIKKADCLPESISLIGKGNKHAIIYLNKSTSKAIAEWMTVRVSESPYLFLGYARKQFSNRISNVALNNIIKKYFRCSPHCLRARSITDTYTNSGRNLSHAQTMARHSSPAITQSIYIQGEKAKEASKFQPSYE